MIQMNIVDRINQLETVGLTSSEIKARLKKDKYSAKLVAEHFQPVESNEIDAQAIMSFIIDNENNYKNNKAFAKAIYEAGHCSEKTAYHILSLMKFVRAYHEILVG